MFMAPFKRNVNAFIHNLNNSILADNNDPFYKTRVLKFAEALKSQLFNLFERYWNKMNFHTMF